MTRKGKCIQTYTGKAFYPLAVRVDDIDIIDIAWALSCICRFGGHCKRYYNVAQHSVLVCDLCDGQYKLGGLLHDAAEAYIGDVCRPIKSMMRIGDKGYQEVEEDIMRCVREKFGLGEVTENERRCVHTADMMVFNTEVRDFMQPFNPECGVVKETMLTKIEPLSQYESYRLFLYRFSELT